MTTVTTSPAANWRVVPLADLVPDDAAILYGILQPGPNVDGGIPYVRPTEIDGDCVDLGSLRHTTPEIASKYRRSVLAAGDVILSIVGTIGKVAVVPPELSGGNITQSSVRIRPCPEVVTSQFIAWALRSPVLTKQYDAARLGTAVPRLNVAHVRALQVPVPPLIEQQRIVAEIERQFTRLDAGVAGLDRARANLKRYRAAVLKAACEGTLVPTEAALARAQGRDYETGDQLLERILIARCENWTGKGKYKAPAPPAIAPRRMLAEGWVWASLMQLTEANRACAYGVLQPGKDCEAGIPLVRVGDINNGKVDTTALKRIAPAIAARYPRTNLRGGELLMSLVGAIGRTAIAPACLAGANTARAVGVIPLTNAINAAFVEIWFRNPSKIAEMTSQAHEVARKTLNLEDVRIATVALPPLAEQHRIVAEVERRLSVIDELETLVETNLARAGRLRQSILAKAFSGDLVPAETV